VSGAKPHTMEGPLQLFVGYEISAAWAEIGGVAAFRRHGVLPAVGPAVSEQISSQEVILKAYELRAIRAASGGAEPIPQARRAGRSRSGERGSRPSTAPFLCSILKGFLAGRADL
jgi:hypothetical protein